MPFISFIIATYNCRNQVRILKETVKSLDGHDVEFLISDGGSVDGTVDELSAIDGIKVVVSSPDKGIYDAWNKALIHAKGSYISFIGVDDVPKAMFITECQKFTSQQKESPAVIYGNAISRYGGRKRVIRTPLMPRLFFDKFPIFDIAHQGMLHSSLLFTDNSFDDNFKLAGDLDFFLKMRSKILKMGIKKVNYIQAEINSEGVSMSPKGQLIYLREYGIIETKHGIKLGYSKIRLKMIGMLSYFPGIYQSLRSVSWFFRSDN